MCISPSVLHLPVSLARQDAIFLLQHFFAHALMEKPDEKYIKVIYAFDSAHVKYGVWIKAGLQPFFPAEPGEINWLSRSKLNQPFPIDSDAVLHMNLIRWIRFGSAEVRRLNRALVEVLQASYSCQTVDVQNHKKSMTVVKSL